MGLSAGKHRSAQSTTNRDVQKLGWRLSTTSRRGSGKHMQKTSPAVSTLYDIPLEVMDIILQKSYLQWVLDSSKEQRDEEVIRYLTAVDLCFFRRITRRQFKNAIWRYLGDYYKENMKLSAMYRNNKYYLVKTIEPNDDLVDSLYSLNCITEKQRDFVRRQLSKQNKNMELLRVVRGFDYKKISDFVQCLQQTNQTAVAKLVETGGVVIKVKLKSSDTTCTESMNTPLFRKRIRHVRSRTSPRSHQNEKGSYELNEEDVDILNVEQQRHTAVFWILIHSQEALELVEKMYESNQLREVFFEDIQQFNSKMITIDRNQFKKAVVVCKQFVKFTKLIEIRGNEYVYGVTKLQNEIYVLCLSYSAAPNVIRVFEERGEFRQQKIIEIQLIYCPTDIASCEKAACLYVPDSHNPCVWKIMSKIGHGHTVTKWLTTPFVPSTLSSSIDGRLLIVNRSTSSLCIYASDGKYLRYIKFPEEIENPRHAVETSIGTFIIIHWQLKNKVNRASVSSGREGETNWCEVLTELTTDGQTLIRCFHPSNETQRLNDSEYLSITTDDQLFVADLWNNRVILFTSDLKWNRIICPTRGEDENVKIRRPWRLYYDERRKQLIVGRFSDGKGVNVYTLRVNYT